MAKHWKENEEGDAMTNKTEITVARATDVPGHEYGRRQLRNFVARYDDGCMGQLRLRGEWEHDVFVTQAVSVYDTELESWTEWVRIDRDGAIVREAA